MSSIPTILRINDATSLAMHACILLSESNSKYNLSELAVRLDSSAHHLSKVLQKLSKAGIIRSIRGISGGFTLAKEPQEISLLNIYEVMEGKFQPSTCLLGGLKCRHSACNLGILLQKITKEVYECFSTSKLSDF